MDIDYSYNELGKQLGILTLIDWIALMHVYFFIPIRLGNMS